MKNKAIIAKLSGGLGNQLFQYACALEIARKENRLLILDATIPLTNKHERLLSINKLNLPYDAIVKLKYDVNDRALTLRKITVIEGKFSIGQKAKIDLIREIDFNYQLIEKSNSDYLYIDGYWQSPKYFINVGKEISDLILQLASTKYDIEIKEKFSSKTAIHLRRGDYIKDDWNLEYHGICKSEYFLKAMQYIKDQVNTFELVLFTDTIESLSDFKNTNDWEVISNNEIDDFLMMTLCSNFIISNSSYSWWAAYIKSYKNNIVICPYPWFGHRKDTPDLIPNNWIRLNRENGNTYHRDLKLIEEATVSVIIPVHNRHEYLEEAVHSAYNQTLKPKEIILSLNNPSDQVVSISEYLKSKFENIIIKKTEKASLPLARNLGIGVASSDWIAFLDDDDIWAPEKLYKQIEHAILMCTNVISCNFNDMSDNIVIQSGIAARPYRMSWKDSLALDNYFSGGSAALVRASLFDIHGLFDEQLPSCEDHDMWRRLSIDNRLFLIDERLVFYRKHRKRMTKDTNLMLKGNIIHTAKILNTKDYSDDLKNYRIKKLQNWINEAFPIKQIDFVSSDKKGKKLKRHEKFFREVNRIFKKILNLKNINKLKQEL